MIEIKRKTSAWLATAIALSFLGEIPLTNENSGEFPVSLDSPAAYARSSGGLTRGGSFQRDSSPSSSSNATQDSNNSSNTSGSSFRGGSFQRDSSPSSSSNATQDSNNSSNTSGSTSQPASRNNQQNRNTTIGTPSLNQSVENRDRSQTSPTPVPNNARDRATSESSVGDRSTTETRSPTTHSSRTNNSGGAGIFLAVIGSVFALIFLVIMRGFFMSLANSSEETDEEGEGVPAELNNEVVTVSKLQIALLANARHVQEQLTATSSEADLETREGLANFLQQSALILLQASDYWSHAPSDSQTFPNRSEAAQFFEKLSVAERSKFSQETFHNEEGEIQQREVEPDLEEDPGAYIVVTFLVGTEDDKPLFDKIYSPEDLETALKQIAATTPDYLLIFELLWSPQDPSDSLTYDELLTEYTDMLQIA